VKSYVVELRADDLVATGERARAAAEQLSREVRWVRSVYVPERETCLLVFEAPTFDVIEGGSDMRKTAIVLLCLAAATIAACGGDDSGGAAASAATPTAQPAPVEFPLAPAHHSGVNGTATLTPDGDNLNVTLKLSKPVAGSLPAHIHTGPCSDEPTMSNPRIWVGLHEVVHGHSETTTNVVTLKELESEPASINVHDLNHHLRPLVCGDLPR
jgi:hypothetical protein